MVGQFTVHCHCLLRSLHCCQCNSRTCELDHLIHILNDCTVSVVCFLACGLTYAAPAALLNECSLEFRSLVTVYPFYHVVVLSCRVTQCLNLDLHLKDIVGCD